MLVTSPAFSSLNMQRAPHLLVVDDDMEIRNLLSTLLTGRGYRVTTAREEQEMRRVLVSSRIDLVILDLMLPGKDGLTICRELRASKPIPIIMLTARGDPTIALLALRLAPMTTCRNLLTSASLRHGSRPFCGGHQPRLELLTATSDQPSYSRAGNWMADSVNSFHRRGSWLN